ncbi:hypothetical protein DL98DRAFT_520603 [Cadophora sp. DSE1049]|nr:hypothetical protein DL98DRAFT_520603 [Cadophora sp. DSE1049]
MADNEISDNEVADLDHSTPMAAPTSTTSPSSPPRSPSTSPLPLPLESSSSTSLPPAYIPTQEQKNAYRWPNAELIATNNIFAFPKHTIDPRTQYPTKRITIACDNVKFVQCWDSSLSGPILQYLTAIPNSWRFDILRLGFAEADTTTLPIVLHLFIGLRSEDPVVSDGLALQIVQDVASMISRNWQGESVYIDVCKPRLRGFSEILDILAPLQLQLSGKDFSNIPAGYYARNPPFPSSSVGQDDSTGQKCTSGTLSGYVKHEHDLYLFTPLHVLHGGFGSLVESPSPIDHQKAKEALQQNIGPLLPRSVVEKVFDSLLRFLSRLPLFSDFWLKIWNDSKKWNPKLGTVTYHSTRKEVNAFDWCLTKLEGLEESQNYNRHVPYNIHDRSSGFRHPPVKGFSPADVDLAKIYFAPGPAFKPIRTTFLANNEICLKPPSRTTREWTIGSVNSIRTYTQSQPGGVLYTLYCIICTTTGDVFSRNGDSGAIVLDKNFQPVAMVQSGDDAVNGNPDITHAVDLPSLLANVEEVNGWAQGSAVFCSGGV